MVIANTEKINDIQMYYEVYGEGEPLLLLHGFTGSGATLREMAKDLAKDFKVIVPDMRGHGRSTNLSVFTFRQVALDIFKLLDKLNIQQFKCIGFSGGGNALLHMAIIEPSRVDAMVVIGSTTHYPEQARKIMAEVSVDTLSENDWKSMREIDVYGDEQIRRLYSNAKDFALDNIDMNFSSIALGTITATTLIIQGDRDFLYPIEVSVEMYKSIPESSLWIVPGGGHLPFTEETMPDFIKTARKFLI